MEQLPTEGDLIQAWVQKKKSLVNAHAAAIEAAKAIQKIKDDAVASKQGDYLPIDFDNIQVGDRIRTVYDNGNVLDWDVDSVEYNHATGKDGNTHAGRVWAYASYYLINRPTPPLPTDPGTVFRATEMRGEKCDVVVFVRQSVCSDGIVFYVSATPIGGMSDFDASDITAWEPIEGVTP